MDSRLRGNDRQEDRKWFFSNLLHKVIRMKTLILKSLLTSLWQREDYFPSVKRGEKGVYPSLAKRGMGRFIRNDAPRSLHNLTKTTQRLTKKVKQVDYRFTKLFNCIF